MASTPGGTRRVPGDPILWAKQPLVCVSPAVVSLVAAARSGRCSSLRPGEGGVVSPRGSGRRAGAARTQVLPHRHGDPNLRAGALVSALVRSRAGSGWKADSCCMRWCCPRSQRRQRKPDPDRIHSHPCLPGLRPSRHTRPRTSYGIKSVCVRRKDSRRAPAEQRPSCCASAHIATCNHIANSPSK